MVEFLHTVTDPHGFHARPAGDLVKLVRFLSSDVEIQAGAQTVNAAEIFAVLSLGVSQGTTLGVRVNGENEKKDAEVLKEFFAANV